MNLSYPFCSHISYLPLHNKLLPKCTNWKQHTFIISQLPWARIQAWLYCVHLPQGFSWTEIKVSSGLWFKWDLKKEKKKKKTCFYVHGTAFQHLVLCGQLNLGSQMLTAVGCRPPSGPGHIGQSIVAASSLCSPRSQWREPASNMEVTVFCHLILEEVSPDLCHSLLVASLSLGSDMLEGREEHKALSQEGVPLQAPRKLSQPQLPHRGPQSWLDSNKAE